MCVAVILPLFEAVKKSLRKCFVLRFGKAVFFVDGFDGIFWKKLKFVLIFLFCGIFAV